MGAIKTIIIADAAMGIDNVWPLPVRLTAASSGLSALVSIPIIVGGSTIIAPWTKPVILRRCHFLGWTMA